MEKFKKLLLGDLAPYLFGMITLIERGVKYNKEHTPEQFIFSNKYNHTFGDYDDYEVIAIESKNTSYIDETSYSPTYGKSIVERNLSILITKNED